MRPPSVGFIYLCTATSACLGFFYYMSGDFWFRRNEPSHGKSAYLYRLATKSEGAQRVQWLKEAMTASCQNGDRELVRKILKEFKKSDIQPTFGGAERFKNHDLYSSVAEGRWTRGTVPALFIVKNTEEARTLTLEWMFVRGIPVGRYSLDDGQWHQFNFKKDKNPGRRHTLRFRVEVDPDWQIFSVAAMQGWTPPPPSKDRRVLGIRFVSMEYAK